MTGTRSSQVNFKNIGGGGRTLLHPIWVKHEFVVCAIEMPRRTFKTGNHSAP